MQFVSNLISSLVRGLCFRYGEGLEVGDSIDEFDDSLISDSIPSDVDGVQEGHVIGDQVARETRYFVIPDFQLFEVFVVG